MDRRNVIHEFLFDLFAGLELVCPGVNHKKGNRVSLGLGLLIRQLLCECLKHFFIPEGGLVAQKNQAKL
jgi:hypothetical protein